MIGAAAIWLFPPAGLDPAGAKALALCLAAVTLFATAVIAEHVTALIFFALAALLAVAPPATIFAGFTSSALWLVIGGLILGVGIQKTGLADRIAGAMSGLYRGSYGRAMFGTVATAMVFLILMPSVMGRVLILIPLVAAIAGRIGYGPGSRGRDGMLIAAALTSFIASGGVLPSNMVNMILAAQAEAAFGVKLTYGAYALAHLPTTGLLKAAIIGLVCWRLFRQAPPATQAPPRERRPWSAAERRMAAILAAALLLWATDVWHRIDAGWIGLAAGACCFVPRLGVLAPQSFSDDVKLAPAFYSAGVIGMGAVLAQGPAGEWLARNLLAALDFQGDSAPLAFAKTFGLSAGLAVAANTIATPAIVAPIADDIARATGLPLETVLLTMATGCTTVFLPHQSAPIVVALQLAGVRYGIAAKATIPIGIATLVVAAPVTFLWWRVLGLL